MFKRKDILEGMQADIGFHAGTVCSGVSCIQDAYEVGVPPELVPNIFFSDYRNKVNTGDLREYLQGH
jgi:hypothetical protein